MNAEDSQDYQQEVKTVPSKEALNSSALRVACIGDEELTKKVKIALRDIADNVECLPSDGDLITVGEESCITRKLDDLTFNLESIKDTTVYNRHERRKRLALERRSH